MKESTVVDIREYGDGLVQWKIIQTSPHRFVVVQTDHSKFGEKYKIILGIYRTWKKADQFLSGYIPEAMSVMGEGSRLKNPPMTLLYWSKKWKIQPKKHSSGALYIPVASLGGASFVGVSSAERELFRLDDYAVSSVSGGALWLVSRKKNPGTKWHRKQEDIHLKKHKGAMSKLGGKYYEGKIHAHQDSIREEWKRKPWRKK